MTRTIWIALVLLIFICGLAAIKFSFATPAKQHDAFDETTTSTDIQPVLAKADKLTASPVNDLAPDAKTVHVIPIAVPELTKPSPPEDKPSRIIGRHWHEGDRKIVTGSLRHQRDPPQTKRTEPKESQLSPYESVRSWFAAKNP